MTRMRWMKQVGFCCVVVAAVVTLARGAWALGPTGAANVPQLSQGQTLSAGQPAVTFLVNEGVTFQARYYDPLAECDGVAPKFVQLFLFTQEGDFLKQDVASSFADDAPFSKFRILKKAYARITDIPLVPGSYRYAFLVRNCTDATSVVLPQFLEFRVFAP